MSAAPNKQNGTLTAEKDDWDYDDHDDNQTESRFSAP